MNLRTIFSIFPPRVASRLISAVIALCISLGGIKCFSILTGGSEDTPQINDGEVSAGTENNDTGNKTQTNGSELPATKPQSTSKPQLFDTQSTDPISTLITSESAVMCAIDEKRVIAAKELKKQFGSGDISVFMTALIVSEKLSKGNITDSEEAVCPAGAARKANYSLSSDVLSVGKRMSIRELLTCMLYQRGSSFAYTLAVHISGSEESFVNEMNVKAKEYGMTDTVFTNVCGAEDKEAVTSAYDTLILLSKFLEDARLRKIFCSDEKITVGMSSQSSVYLTVSNDFFETHCTPWQAKADGIIGGKTGALGYLQWAIVLFSDGDNEYAVAVLGSLSPFSDALKIYAEYRP